MFRNADSAMRWAGVQMNRLIIDSPCINTMQQINSSRGLYNDLTEGLTPQQVQIQANLIKRYAMELTDQAASEYLQIKYFCSDKYEALMNQLLSRLLYSGGVRRRGIQDLMLEYVGRKQLTQRDLRHALKCDANAVARYKDQVYAALDSIHYRAMAQIEERMIEAGLIER